MFFNVIINVIIFLVLREVMGVFLDLQVYVFDAILNVIIF